MFIVGRLFGITTYCLLLLLVLSLLKKNCNSKKIFLFYTIVLSIMAYLFLPAETADLARIFNILDEYSNYSFERILYFMGLSSTPISVLYFWCFSKIGLYHLLPAVSTFICFTNLFYIINDYSEKKHISKNTLVLVVFFLMSTGFYMELISNIRDMLAYSIVARCIYNELYNGKSIFKNIPFYILAFLIHQSALLLLAARILFFVLNEKKINVFLKIFFLISMTIIMLLSYKYILFSIKKYVLYKTNEMYFWLWEYIKTIIEFILCLIIIYYYKQKKIGTNYYILNLIMMFFALVNCNEYSMFLRFNYFNVFLIIPILVDVAENSAIKRFGLRDLIIVMSVLLLAISCIRGDLSSLKYF